MKLIYDIFEKLHIDQTFFAQFALVVVLFFLIKILLMSKLQEVLDLREGKTIKREEGANKKFMKAEELAEKYTQRIARANHEAQKKFEQKKNEVNRKQENAFSDAMSKVNEEVEKKREELSKDVEAHRAAMMNERDTLVNQLVEKITR